MDNILVAMVVTAVLRYYFCAKAGRKTKRVVGTNGTVLEAVGHVSALNLYPVKSARGIQLTHGQCTPSGFTTADKKLHDRQWTVSVPKKDGLTQAQSRRQISQLALVSTRIYNGNLILEAPGVNPLTVPLDIKLNQTTDTFKTKLKVSTWADVDSPVECIDCGDVAARWLQYVLRVPETRLVLVSPDVGLRPLARQSWEGKMESYNVRCQDAAPFMLLSQASLDDLNSRLKDQVSMGQFRPTLEVKGCGPYEEDTWLELKIGDAVFQKVEKCFRCTLVTVSETTGRKHPQLEPLEFLKTYRPLTEWQGTVRPMFGVWYKLLKLGTVRVGDTVWLAKKMPEQKA